MTPSLLILGLHYGGTSVVAAIVEALGYDIGECGEPNATHPLGNKEDIKFLDWATEVAVDDRYPLAPNANQLEVLKYLIAVRDSRGKPWAVKLPLMDFYGSWAVNYMENPRIIQVERDLNAVSRSYATKEDISEETARTLHTGYLTALYTLLHYNPGVPYHAIHYENLIRNPWREIRKLDLFLHGEESPHEVLEPAVNLILPKWKHF